MAIRYYLIPIFEQFDGTGIVLQFRTPKYLPTKGTPFTPLITNDQNLPQFWEMRDFGLEPTALVAINVTPAQHTLLAAQSDIVVIPTNIDNNVGAANLATVQAALENLHIPGDAVVAGTTYRQIIRGVTAIFAVAQRFDGMAGGRLFPVGVTLSTQLSDLSANIRQKLQQAATDLGYDYGGLTLTSTLRDVLKTLANQTAPQTMLGVAI